MSMRFGVLPREQAGHWHWPAWRRRPCGCRLHRAAPGRYTTAPIPTGRSTLPCMKATTTSWPGRDTDPASWRRLSGSSPAPRSRGESEAGALSRSPGGAIPLALLLPRCQETAPHPVVAVGMGGRAGSSHHSRQGAAHRGSRMGPVVVLRVGRHGRSPGTMTSWLR